MQMTTITTRVVKPEIPHGIITELLGGVRFAKNEEKDLQYAESIAGQTYHSMKYLLDTIGSFIETPKYKKEFERFRKDIPENPYFAPYFKSHP